MNRKAFCTSFLLGSLLLVMVCSLTLPNSTPISTSSFMVESQPQCLSYGSVPDGFVETNFTMINIKASDIVIADQVQVTELVSTIDCYTNLTSYNVTGNYWHIRLPSTFADASNYVIQRGQTEIYYCFYDNEGRQNRYSGIDTYWEFSANILTRDILQFTITSPVAVITKLIGNSTHKIFDVLIPRLSNTLRTYSQVEFNVDFTFPFDSEFDVAIWSYTGGQAYAKDITKDCGLILSTKAGSSQWEADVLNIRFNMGAILSYTDYEFRIIFVTAPASAQFFDEWFMNLVIPIVAGIGGSVTIGPPFWNWVLKGKGKRVKLNSKYFMTYGIVTILVVGGLTMLYLYSSFINKTATFFPYHQ